MIVKSRPLIDSESPGIRERNPGVHSFWDLTSAREPLHRRFLSDGHEHVTLDRLRGGTILSPWRQRMRGANVLMATNGQLANTIALLELDGLADRVVLCPPGLGPDQLIHVIATAEVTVVVSDHPLPWLADSGVAVVVTSAANVVPADDDRSAPGVTEWILLTSGTTGQPKVVVHTLHSLAGAIQRSAPAADGTVWSTFYDTRRYGGLQILLRAMIGGASMVFCGADEPLGDFLARAGAAGVTHISGTPTHWRRALLSPAANRIAPSYVRLSGEPADAGVLDKLRAAYPAAKVEHAFASTEAGVAFVVPDGRPGFPASLLEPNDNSVELRVEGNSLRVRSERTAIRYLGNHAEPLRDEDGFVDTGDVVELHGDRYHFAGRRDGVINVGGLKVHPEEVEAVINTHARVHMSLVKAKRSPITGSVVVADVMIGPPAGADGNGEDNPTIEAIKAEILAVCRQTLAPYKVPAAIRIVQSLDIQLSGKLARAHA